ncbi:MAG: MarR family winged helix-turn-helix transcriptional regulator [Thermoleophilaceae bacterium]
MQVGALELEAWVGLLQAHHRLVQELDSELERAHGLTLGEYEVLLQLSRAPESRLRMSELADAVLLTKSGLTRLVDRLEGRRLVERTKCPSDLRGFHAVLTGEGRERLREAAPTHVDGIHRLFLDRLEPGEAERLAQVWRRLGADGDAAGCGADL